MTTYRIRNLHKFQHYRNRNPPWIKWHRACLNDPDFIALPDAQKWHAVALVLFASETDGVIPGDPTFLSARLGLRTKIDLRALLNCGFLETYGDASKSASTVSNCKLKSACSEGETEGEGETEREKHPERVQRSAKNDLPPGFVKFWILWRETGRARYKRQALDEWKKQKLEKHANAICRKLSLLIDHKAECDKRKQFHPDFPDPHRWLKNKRWNDELPT